MKETSKFKQEYSLGTSQSPAPLLPSTLLLTLLEKRKEQAAKINEKHPHRIPVTPLHCFVPAAKTEAVLK